MKKLTPTQNELLKKVLLYCNHITPMHYDKIKNLCNFKTFDASFNVLLHKGYVKRYRPGDGENTYILK